MKKEKNIDSQILITNIFTKCLNEEMKTNLDFVLWNLCIPKNQTI